MNIAITFSPFAISRRFSTALLVVVAACCLGTVPAAAQQTAEIVAAVSLDSMMRDVDVLCGDAMATIGGADIMIDNRYDGTGERSNELAGDYLTEQLSAYGLTVTSHSFQDRGRNIIAVQPGVVYPDISYIICAHYDAPRYMYPGGDDNASGTAAVLEAARLLSAYRFEYSIGYMLWDAEERGLVGSNFYAEEARLRGDSILGVLNLDMIA